jgi:hypothetical protein
MIPIGIEENIMMYTLESTVGELLSDSVAVEILEKYAPGITTNPLIGFAKGMSLQSLLSFPQVRQNGITEEKILTVLSEIEAQKKKLGQEL